MNVLLNLNEGNYMINESYDLQLTSEIKILDSIEVDNIYRKALPSPMLKEH